jgi:hypothetical protein
MQACSVSKNHFPTKNIVSDFYKVYAQRSNFEQFLSYYSEDAILEDIINGDKIEGKAALKSFFDWSNPNFKKNKVTTLVVSEQIIDGNKAVVKGYFTPFQWGTASFEAMHFTTILTFNAAGKIIKQVDWINYPANLIDYSKRKNANEWIEEKR